MLLAESSHYLHRAAGASYLLESIYHRLSVEYVVVDLENCRNCDLIRSAAVISTPEFGSTDDVPPLLPSRSPRARQRRLRVPPPAGRDCRGADGVHAARP